MRGNTPSPPTEVCPFLGLRNDRDARYGFPTDGNVCHREGGPRDIRLDYQQDICLGGRYRECPIFLQVGPLEPEPAPARRGRRTWWIAALILLALLCGLSLAAGDLLRGFLPGGPDSPTRTPGAEQPAPVQLPSLTPLPQVDATQPPAGNPPTATLVLTETPSPTPTETPTILPPTDTEVPTETATEPPPTETPDVGRITETPAP